LLAADLCPLFDPSPSDHSLVIAKPELILSPAAINVSIEEDGTERQRQDLLMPVRRQLRRDGLDQLLRLVIDTDDKGKHALAVVEQMGYQVIAGRLVGERVPGKERARFCAIPDPFAHCLYAGIVDFPARRHAHVSGVDGQVIEFGH
jgi:hypothetical protein